MTLQEKGIRACGTVRKGRADMPKDLKSDKDLVRGDFDYRC